MKKNRILWSGALCLAALVLPLTAGAALALEEDRRIVKKIHIVCEDGDCEHETVRVDGGHLHNSWLSGDGPGRFVFGTAVGGGFLGVASVELTPELRTHFGVADDAGVMVSQVVDESPAQQAGLQVGDIITAIDGQPVASVRALARAIRSREEGEAVLIELWRDGSVQNLTALLEEREAKLHTVHHAFGLDCEGDDCGPYDFMKGHGLDIECEDGPCKIQVRCDDDGDCVCTVDGEETDCGELHRGKR